MALMPGFPTLPPSIVIHPGIVLLPARIAAADLLPALPTILAAAPLRHMTVPGGRQMSVATSSCGTLGWCSDVSGYRYLAHDPLSGRPWPVIPAAWRELASACAAQAGFPAFDPDACLINAYAAGSRLSRHRDADEQDLDAPIVSVSLGAPARFVLGGLQRTDPVQAIWLRDGDVLVWGGPMRLIHHGVGSPRGRVAGHVFNGEPALAPYPRINLTFRHAGPAGNSAKPAGNLLP